MSIKIIGLAASHSLCICVFIFHTGLTLASEGGSWFFGISAGISNIDIDDLEADRIDDSGTYIKLIADYAINNNFAMEYGYLDYGSFSAQYSNADEKVTVDGFALIVSTVGNVSITRNISLLGKIGLDYWSEDVHANFNFGPRPQSASGHGSGICPLVGIGMQYNISQDLLIRVELENHQGIDVGVDLVTNGLEPIELSKKNVNLIGATVLYAF